MGEALKPTDYAKVHFNTIKSLGDRLTATQTDDQYKMILGSYINTLGFGLEEMATGLRATYILLEQINQKLDRLSLGNPR